MSGSQTLAATVLGTTRGDCGFLLRDVSFAVGGVVLASFLVGALVS